MDYYNVYDTTERKSYEDDDIICHFHDDRQIHLMVCIGTSDNK